MIPYARCKGARLGNVNEDGTEVGIVQVQADADSMRSHMEVIADHR